MDTIVDFLVDNYIWVLIISVFLIIVLIGYIADQKRKLKKVKEQNAQGVTNNEININTPAQEAVQNVNVAPAPIAVEPIVNEPINIVPDAIETPTFEPVSNEINESVAESPVSEVVEQPVFETPVVENPISEEIAPVTEPVNDLISEPIVEEAPQTILDIPDNVTDINVPVQENIISESIPIEIETPVIDDTEIISEPEIIEEISTPQNVVNSWEPELAQENKDIINETEIKDSI